MGRDIILPIPRLVAWLPPWEIDSDPYSSDIQGNLYHQWRLKRHSPSIASSERNKFNTLQTWRRIQVLFIFFSWLKPGSKSSPDLWIILAWLKPWCSAKPLFIKTMIYFTTNYYDISCIIQSMQNKTRRALNDLCFYVVMWLFRS